MQNRAFLKWSCLLTSLVFSLGTQAADAVKPAVEAISFSQIVNLLGGLIFVLMIFFLVVFLLKRVSGFNGLSKGHLQIVDALHLGTKERLLIVRVNKQHLLIATSAQGIQPLHVIEGELQSAENASASNADGQNNFSQLLSRFKTSEA